MIVTSTSLKEALAELSNSAMLAIDTETTGLRPYHGDHLFSIAIATALSEYYFSFNPEQEHCLSEADKAQVIAFLNSLTDKTLIFHNAKFDLAMLEQFGVTLDPLLNENIYDTMVMERLLYNDTMSLSLDSCVKKLGVRKDDAVMDYITEHGLWEWEEVPGLSKRVKNLFFSKVPLDLISVYACKDVRITYDLAVHQKLYKDQRERALHPLWTSEDKVFRNERELLPIIYTMERQGVRVDPNYCEEALFQLHDRKSALESEFHLLSGVEFKDSGVVFKELFAGDKILHGEPTATGKINPRFDSQALAQYKNPLAKIILALRDLKKTQEFFQGFLYQMDSENRLHSSLSPCGTMTGRFAMRSLNLQQLTKDENPEEGQILVRKALIPDPGYFFAMFDYDQMEYKLMLDYAGSLDLIHKVRDLGVDVHEATAQVAGISRSTAKTVNFAILYGSGNKLLAEKLNITVDRAKEIKRSIFDAAPEVEFLIKKIQEMAHKRGFIFNWAGRRYRFPNSRFVYKAPNYLIQGGCADIVKFAMVSLYKYLKPYRTKMLLCIHDELLFQVHESEKHILPDIKAIMEGVYKPRNGLPMSCGVEHSFTSFAERIEGFPV